MRFTSVDDNRNEANTDIGNRYRYRDRSDISRYEPNGTGKTDKTLHKRRDEKSTLDLQ